MAIQYPTLAEVELANYVQLMWWRKHLPDPGDNYLENHDVEGDFFSMTRRAWYTVRAQEEKEMDLIHERSKRIKAQLER